MDWGMMSRSAICNLPWVSPKSDVLENSSSAAKSFVRSLLRPNLRFGTGLSVLIVLLDIVLRFSWLLRFVEEEMFTNSDEYILCSQLFEVARRALWNLLRIEWEGIQIYRLVRGRSSCDLY